jgi:hypothetical protein
MRWILIALSAVAAPLVLSAQPIPPPPPPPPTGGSGAILLPPVAIPIRPDGPARVLIPDVLPPPPAWIFGLDLSLLKSRFRGDWPGGDLQRVVSPEILAGYRFDTGRMLHLDYRFFVDSGSTLLPAGEISNRVDGHTLDLNFRFLDDPLGTFTRSRWDLGVRGALVFFDANTAFSLNPAWVGGTRMTHHFIGAGPHADYRIAAGLQEIGLEVFAQSDLALLYGQRTVRAMPIAPQPPGSPLPQSDTSDGFIFQGKFRFGVDWTLPLRFTQVRVGAGYQIDAWLFPGVGFSSPGNLFNIRQTNLVNRGPFVRVEFSY